MNRKLGLWRKHAISLTFGLLAILTSVGSAGASLVQRKIQPACSSENLVAYTLEVTLQTDRQMGSTIISGEKQTGVIMLPDIAADTETICGHWELGYETWGKPAQLRGSRNNGIRLHLYPAMFDGAMVDLSWVLLSEHSNSWLVEGKILERRSVGVTTEIGKFRIAPNNLTLSVTRNKPKFPRRSAVVAGN